MGQTEKRGGGTFPLPKIKPERLPKKTLKSSDFTPWGERRKGKYWWAEK